MMPSVIWTTVIGTLLLSTGISGSSVRAEAPCEIGRETLDRLCSAGRLLSRNTREGCDALAVILADSCDGDAEPAAGPIVISDSLEIQNGEGVAQPIGGVAFALTDILATTTFDQPVLLFLQAQPQAGLCVSQQTVPIPVVLQLTPNQQLSVNLTTPITFAADEKLCMFAQTLEQVLDGGVDFTLIGTID